jgi:uncharacterized membrane protein YhaH (DUF805 family)
MISLFFSSSGNLQPRGFALAVVGAYVASAASQGLLGGPVAARFNVIPFALVQLALVWIWFSLHAKRLRDAGRPVWPAVCFAVMYFVALAVLLVVMSLFLQVGAGKEAAASPISSMLGLYLLLYFFGILFGVVDGGAFALFLAGLIAVIYGPVLLAIGFSIWAGTRPSRTEVVSPYPAA